MPGTVTTGSGAPVWAPHLPIVPRIIATATTPKNERTRLMLLRVLLPRLANGGHGIGNDLVDAELPQRRRRSARIPGNAGGAASRRVEFVGTHHRRIDCHQERSVGHTSVTADCGVAETLGAQSLHVGGLRHLIISVDEMRARGGAGPFAIERRRHILQIVLIAAMIADQHDMEKAGLPEAACGAF